MNQLLLATRSAHKAREIRAILAHQTRLLVTLDDVGISASDQEDELEHAPTFLENARAKALYFARSTGLPTLADDSGLEVDALNREPGVRTRRFALDAGCLNLSPTELDRVNNQLLLDRLTNVPAGRRGARYVCAAVMVTPDGRSCASLGTCLGEIALASHGDGGFGYDPLFYLPDLCATFAQLSSGLKNERSHRARAFRALATILH
ncbi:MAG: non-canonical purine NTP pyrophosphatase [Longimicrobiales bacterium]